MKLVLPIKTMKKTSLAKSVCALACLTCGIYISTFTMQSNAGLCNSEVFSEQQSSVNYLASHHCSPKGNEVSWFAWLTNNSTSNQFHFLDLLELLSNFSSDDE